MLSETGIDHNFPYWLKDIFTLMMATYGNLWANQFLDKETSAVIKRMWWLNLKDYTTAEVNEAMLEIIRTLAYPPKPVELISAVKSVRQKRLREEEKRMWEMNLKENRLLTKEKMPPSRDVLHAKAEMWVRLGKPLRAQECLDEINRMDLQEK
jgi:hypothetical protein